MGVCLYVLLVYLVVEIAIVHVVIDFWAILKVVYLCVLTGVQGGANG